MRELWAIATAEAPVPPNIYVRYHQWQVSGLSAAEMSQLAAEAKAAPEGPKAGLHSMLSGLPSLNSDPVDIQVWATPDIWRLNMDYPDLPGKVSGSGDSAASKTLQWVRSGPDVTILPEGSPKLRTMNPRRQYIQHERTARAIWTGGLTELMVTKFDLVTPARQVSADSIEMLAEGMFGSSPARLQLRVKGQVSPSGEAMIDEFSGRMVRVQGGEAVMSVFASDWGSLPGTPGIHAPRVIECRGTAVLTRTQFIDASEVSYSDVERNVDPPLVGRPDRLRDNLVIKSVANHNSDGTWTYSTDDGTTRLVDPNQAPQTVRMTGWAVLSVLFLAVLYFVYHRRCKHV